MTIERFMSDIKIIYQENSAWRCGQVLFNYLYTVNPDLADKIRGTELDPFYNDARIRDCINFLKSEWTDNDNILHK